MDLYEDQIEEPPWKRCRHVESVGEMAVYVGPGCPKLHMIHGKLGTSKRECRECGKEKRA